MEIILFTVKIIAVLIGVYLLISGSYILIHGIAGHFFKINKIVEPNIYPNGVVFIPAFKEDEVIFPVALRAVQQDYPGNFDVVIIADQLQKETLEKLNTLPITIVDVDFKKSTKAKALNFAMNQISGVYDFAIVLDADNVMKKGAVKQFSHYIAAGHDIIQGRRTALNLESDFSFLDSLSEEINNHIYNAGSNALKFSSRIVGSGVAFQYNLFKRLMKEINVVGGFDKALELKVIQERKKIIYAPEIVTYDEKVEGAEVFGQQRSRWLSAQYQFFFKNINQAFLQLAQGNIDYVAKFFQYILPPRLLFPIVCFLGSILLFPFYPLGAGIWMLAFVFVTFAYFISIPKRFLSKQLFASSGAILTASYETVKALFKMKSASKTFIHTPHKGTEISSYDK